MVDHHCNGSVVDLAARTLLAYAQRLAKSAPRKPERRWVETRLRDPELDLAAEIDGKHVPTRAARLLFGKGEEVALELRVFDEPEPQLIRGNLLSVLDRTLDVLGEFNQPFTLKGRASETVRPYPPLAFKELVVNALVHRDYERAGPVRVEIGTRQVRFSNPGGLVEGLDPERLGEPAQKAYRNPVIADLLYGTGAMDKEGSGLADIRRWARENGGATSFGPSEDNSNFMPNFSVRLNRADGRFAAALPTPSDCSSAEAAGAPLWGIACVGHAALCT